MAEEKLTLVTRVQGAAAVVTDVRKIEGAIDRVASKAAGLRARLGGIGGGLAGTIAGGLRDQVASEVIYRAPQMVAEKYEEVAKQTADMTKNVVSTGEDMLKNNPTIADINTSIAAIDTAIKGYMDNPFTYFLGGGDSARDLKALRDKYEEQKRVLVQEGSDTERALRNNANTVVQAINGQPAPVVNVAVNVSGGSTQSVTYTAGTQTQSDYFGGAPRSPGLQSW